MNQSRKKRLVNLILILLGVLVGVGLVLYALRSNIDLYYTPHQLGQATLGKPIHLAGKVVRGSVKREKNNLEVYFEIKDSIKQIEVRYVGLLPSLFKDDQTVVLTGYLISPRLFIAKEVLAKHDEKYNPIPIK